MITGKWSLCSSCSRSFRLLSVLVSVCVVERDLDVCIQLASDAQSVIAMTDDEKKRVAELLVDLDSLPEIPEDHSLNEVSLCTVNVVDNSFKHNKRFGDDNIAYVLFYLSNSRTTWNLQSISIYRPVVLRPKMKLN